MRKRLAIGSVIGLVAMAVGSVSWAVASSQVTGAMTVTVIEHATTDRVFDMGKAGDSTGDLLTFHNKVYDETDTTVAGNDQGACVRMSPKAGTWECNWTTYLADGQITVQGPFYDTRDSTLAILGGTGTYENARGSMDLEAMEGGAEYAFVFNLIP